MSRKSVHSISLAVSKVQLEAGGQAHDLESFRCQSCSLDLAIHQPDFRNPDRLLGMCPGCRGWSLIECHPDNSMASVAVLPSLGTPDPLRWGGNSEDGRLRLVPARPRNQRSRLGSSTENPEPKQQD